MDSNLDPLSIITSLIDWYTWITNWKLPWLDTTFECQMEACATILSLYEPNKPIDGCIGFQVACNPHRMLVLETLDGRTEERGCMTLYGEFRWL